MNLLSALQGQVALVCFCISLFQMVTHQWISTTSNTHSAISSSSTSSSASLIAYPSTNPSSSTTLSRLNFSLSIPSRILTLSTLTLSTSPLPFPAFSTTPMSLNTHKQSSGAIQVSLEIISTLAIPFPFFRSVSLHSSNHLAISAPQYLLYPFFPKSLIGFSGPPNILSL